MLPGWGGRGWGVYEQECIGSARCEETPQGKRLRQSDKEGSRICCQKISSPLEERRRNQWRSGTKSALRQTWFWLWSPGTSVLFGKPAHVSTPLKKAQFHPPPLDDRGQWNWAAYCSVPALNQPSSQEMEPLPVWRREGWEACVLRDREGLQLLITHT